MAVNVRGPMLVCKYALPHLIAGGGGVVVNISSALSLIGTGRVRRLSLRPSKTGCRLASDTPQGMGPATGPRCPEYHPDGFCQKKLGWQNSLDQSIFKSLEIRRRVAAEAAALRPHLPAPLQPGAQILPGARV